MDLIIMKTKSLITLVLLLNLIPLSAKSNTETLGDILAAALPLGAYGATLYNQDKEGQYQMYNSYGATMATVVALKYTIKEERPDKSNNRSFPSGHTASAFAGAGFIHKHYGLKYAIVPYILATYTGYSRVHESKHFTRDVLAGATIATLSNWYFVEPYKNFKISPTATSEFQGIKVSYKF